MNRLANYTVQDAKQLPTFLFHTRLIPGGVSTTFRAMHHFHLVRKVAIYYIHHIACHIKHIQLEKELR